MRVLVNCKHVSLLSRCYSTSVQLVKASTPNIKLESDITFPNGLLYAQNYIPEESEQKCILEIQNALNRFTTSARTSTQFKRTILNFHSKTFEQTVPQLMPTLYEYMQRTYRDGIFQQMPNTIQINQYQDDNYGCPMHCDAKSLGPTIAMFSFQSNAIMHMLLDPPPNITQDQVEKMKSQIRLLLTPGSLLVLTDEVRYKWLHGIKQDSKIEKWENEDVIKQERISVVFWYQK